MRECVWPDTWAAWLGSTRLPCCAWLGSLAWFPGLGNIIKAIRFSKYDNLCNKLEIYAILLASCARQTPARLVALIGILFYCWTVLIHI